MRRYSEENLMSLFEKDLDRTFIEVLTRDVEICQRFLDELSLPQHEVVQITDKNRLPDGQTDLAIYLSNGHLIMIENKINAEFTERQPERYRERGEQRVTMGDCTSFSTVLLAPEAYIHANQPSTDFDHYITYEWFLNEVKGKDEMIALAENIDMAIVKNEVGYLRIFHEGNTHRFQAIIDLIRLTIPKLKPNKPTSVPKDRHFLYTGYPDTVGIKLVYKMRPYSKTEPSKVNHRVDLEFQGRVASEIEKEYGSLLDEGMDIVQLTDKTSAIRISLPHLMNTDIEGAEQKYLKGISELERMYHWCENFLK